MNDHGWQSLAKYSSAGLLKEYPKLLIDISLLGECKGKGQNDQKKFFSPKYSGMNHLNLNRLRPENKH